MAVQLTWRYYECSECGELWKTRGGVEKHIERVEKGRGEVRPHTYRVAARRTKRRIGDHE